MSTSSNPAEMLGQWQNHADKYWKGLQELGQKLVNAQQPGKVSPPWSEGLEQLAKLYTSGANGASGNEALFDRLMSQGKGFVAMLEQMYQAGQTKQAPDFSALTQPWLADLNKHNPFMQSFGMPGLSMPNFGMGSFTMPEGGMPNTEWLTSLGKLGTGMSGMNLSDPKSFLNMPSFGLNRESQERQQDLIKQVGAYQSAMQRYQQLMTSSQKAAIGRMQSKLEERSEPGRQLDSMKAVYDLWIDSLEETFAETAMTADYQAAYGTLVDAQMRMRQNIQKQIELQCGQMGMPTRGELEGVHKKLADLRRSSRAQKAPAAVDELREELAELRREVAALKLAAAAPAPLSNLAAAPQAVANASPTPAKANVKAPVKPAAKIKE